MSLHLPDFESRDLNKGCWHCVTKVMQQWVISANQNLWHILTVPTVTEVSSSLMGLLYFTSLHSHYVCPITYQMWSHLPKSWCVHRLVEPHDSAIPHQSIIYACHCDDLNFRMNGTHGVVCGVDISMQILSLLISFRLFETADDIGFIWVLN